ncbi:hypothetical protein BDR05DRAFT_889777 [Suillus weaverae]|nr:hypothetical protein BDR05DRAFT_889777 [Suillus weaverae]
MRLLLCIFLHLIGVIQAAPTIITATTDGSDALSFTTRTMWTIVSSCILTLLACIYSVIHPNIPSPEDSPNCILRRRLGIMIVALIAPELIVTWAMRQWFSAHDAWTQTHSSFVLMGGFMLYADGKPCLTLRPSYILNLIHEGYIDVPTITAKQIRDRSKGNAISKGLVMLQVAWIIMQLITRAIYQLETTQLEVGTLAFAVLNFLTYAVWWNKPLDVECPHPVYWKSTESRPEDHIDVHNERNEFPELKVIYPVVRPILELIGAPRIPISRKLRVPTLDGSINLENSDKMVLQLAALLMATVFGSIHCMAWFFAFPTHQEQVLWRMSAVAITFTPWLCFPMKMNLNSESISKVVMFVYGMIRLVSVVLYITARAVLLVLMFTTLCNLPPDAYKAVSWTSVVPHL